MDAASAWRTICVSTLLEHCTEKKGNSRKGLSMLISPCVGFRSFSLPLKFGGKVRGMRALLDLPLKHQVLNVPYSVVPCPHGIWHAWLIYLVCLSATLLFPSWNFSAVLLYFCMYQLSVIVVSFGYCPIADCWSKLGSAAHKILYIRETICTSWIFPLRLAWS